MQTDHEDRVVAPEDTRPVDPDSDSIQTILYQLLDKTNEMASRLDRILARAEKVPCDVDEADENGSLDRLT